MATPMLEVLSSSDVLFDASSQRLVRASATWVASSSIFTVVQLRAEEVDDSAAERAVALLSTLAERTSTGSGVELRMSIEHVLAGLGTPYEPNVAIQRSALSAVLEHAVAGGGALANCVASAAASCTARGSDGYETLVPRLLSTGAPSLSELVRLSVETGVLSAVQRSLASCAEPKQRQRALDVCTHLWEHAMRRWPEAFEGAASATDARPLAARLVNTVVDTCIYDTVSRLRCSATRLLQTLAPCLKGDEVIRLALLKARDKDKTTRGLALNIIGSVLTADADAAARLSPANVQQIVLHARSASGAAAAPADASRAERRAAPDEQQQQQQQAGVASAVFWAYAIHRQERLAAALSELRVCEQLDLYEPLLTTHIAEAFAAAFPDGVCTEAQRRARAPAPQSGDRQAAAGTRDEELVIEEEETDDEDEDEDDEDAQQQLPLRETYDVVDEYEEDEAWAHPAKRGPGREVIDVGDEIDEIDEGEAWAEWAW